MRATSSHRNAATSAVWVALLSSAVFTGVALAQDAGSLPAAAITADTDDRLDTAADPVVGVMGLDKQFNFNGLALQFAPQMFATVPLESGTSRDFLATGNIVGVRDVTESQTLDLSPQGSRLVSRQKATVFQLGVTQRDRTITRQIDENGTLLGFRLDLSVTGRCILPGTQPEDYCTYTPGLATAPGVVDPDTLAPAGFIFSSEFGQVIGQDVHDSLAAPGFQRGEDVPGAPLVGVAVDVLNAGFANDPGRDAVSGRRHLQTDVRLVPSIGLVEQDLFANSEKAAAARTTRAFVLPARKDMDEAYFLMQLAAFMLPQASAEIGYLDGVPSGNVSNNLFLALNNARVPGSSYTIFQTGRVDVATPATPPRSAAETPVATYTGFWMGLSTVRDITTTMREQFIPTGERTSVTGGSFAEGGIGSAFGDLLDAGVTIVNDLDQSILDLNLQNIDDLYVQLGLDVTRQRGIRRMTNTENTRFRLVPHLSLNGNRTGGEHVLRYYSGVILNDDPNAYIGMDYTLATESGWSAAARLDLYSAPDADYRSEAQLRASRTFTLSPERQITLGAGALTDIDADALVNGDNFLRDQENSADLFLRWREGAFNLSVSERFTTDTDGDDAQSTTFGLTYRDSDAFSVSGQITPLSTEKSYVEAAFGLNLTFEDVANAPVLSAQIARIRNDIGTSTTGFALSETETVVQAVFRVNF